MRKRTGVERCVAVGLVTGLLLVAACGPSSGRTVPTLSTTTPAVATTAVVTAETTTATTVPAEEAVTTTTSLVPSLELDEVLSEFADLEDLLDEVDDLLLDL